MTDQETLQAAIKKAQKNGWSGYDAQHVSSSPDEKGMPISGFIFSHDFCRAFFGVDYTQNYYDTTPNTGWAWHLQQMVLEYEPIKYLEQFLKD